MQIGNIQQTKVKELAQIHGQALFFNNIHTQFYLLITCTSTRRSLFWLADAAESPKD